MIDISADVLAKIGQASDDLHQLVNKWARWERQGERYLFRPFGFHVPSEPFWQETTQIAVAYDVGGPAEGRIWQVDRFFCDVVPLGSPRPAGVMIALASAPGEREGETINLNASSMFWRGTNTEWGHIGYPAYDDWGSREMVIQPLDHLFVIAIQPPEIQETTSEALEAHQVAGRVQVTDIAYHDVGSHQLAFERF